jgi:hypothetical protein
MAILRQPPPPPAAPRDWVPGGDVAAEIKNQATASLVVGLLGVSCCIGFSFVLGPLAIYRGSKALRLIGHYGIGQEHATSAKVGRVLGILAIVVFVGGMMVGCFMGATGRHF